MLDTLIREGYTMQDIDSFTEEELFDLVNAKVRLKEIKEGKHKTSNNSNNNDKGAMPLEDFINGFKNQK